MKPLVSVIVPVYRAEKYIEGCVRSLQAQSYDQLEIILIDDGSPDESPAICDAFALWMIVSELSTRKTAGHLRRVTVDLIWPRESILYL